MLVLISVVVISLTRAQKAAVRVATVGNRGVAPHPIGVKSA
jgi:hypothetical protein